MRSRGLGADPAALIAALRKFDEINGVGPKRAPQTHPSTEARIQALTALFPSDPEIAQDRAA